MAHLKVLQAAKRGLVVGKQLPGIGDVVHHAQGRQRLVAVNLATLFGGAGAGQGNNRAVVPFGADVFEADTRGDGPLADIDLVIDVERVGLSAASTVLIDMAITAPARRRHIVRQQQAGGLLVHALLEIAIADADFLGAWAHIEHMGHTRLDAKSVIGAWVRTQGELIDVGDIAATEAVGIVGQHFGLGTVVDLADVLEGHVLAPASEIIPVTHRLVRVGIELLLGQATGHVGAGVVVVEVQREIVLIGRRPMGLQDHVVDVVGVVAVAVAVALDPGIQQRHADAVVGGAADKGVFDVLPAAVRGGFQGGADFTGEFLGDRAGHEVDHTTHVLWPVTHGTGATDDVDAVQVAGGPR